MEFLELLEHVLAEIPPEYAAVSQAISSVLPWIVMAVSLLVCFLGYKIHHLWAGFLFFCIGFLIGAVTGVLFPQLSINFVLLVALVLGTLGTVFSHRLLKLKLFLVNFFLVYAALPNILAYALPWEYSILIGLVVAIMVGLIAAKFKYIVTIITSAYVGAVTAVPLLMSLAGWDQFPLRLLLSAVFIIAGLLVQFKLEKRAQIREKAKEQTKEHTVDPPVAVE